MFKYAKTKGANVEEFMSTTSVDIWDIDDDPTSESLVHSGGDVVGVVVYKFPAKSNTFVVNELLELIKNGIDIHIYSVDSPMQEDLEFFKDELDIIGDRITYILDDQLFTWGSLHREAIPLSNNQIRSSLRMLPDESVEELECASIEKSDTVFRNLILKMKKDNIGMLYAPFANLGSEICLHISHHMEIPFTFSCHSHDLFNMSGYGKLKGERASAIFPISIFNKHHLINEFGTHPSKIFIKRVNFISESKGEVAPKEYDYILGVGRLIEMKGFDISIRAFKEFLKTNPDMHYVIAGSGGKMDELVELTHELDISDKVHFTGYINNSEVVDLIQNATFSILSSIISRDGDCEGIPTFFLESMSCGVPCIGTNYSGIPELISDGENGRLVPIGDVDAVHNAMVDLYSDIKVNGECISKKCKKSVNELFDNDMNTKIMVDKFKEILDDNI
jgi:colanic acid/amylovoran biosynthesis glycosyltransferase